MLWMTRGFIQTATPRTAFLCCFPHQNHNNPDMLPYPTLSLQHYCMYQPAAVFCCLWGRWLWPQYTFSLIGVQGIYGACEHLTSGHHGKLCRRRPLLWIRGLKITIQLRTLHLYLFLSILICCNHKLIPGVQFNVVLPNKNAQAYRSAVLLPF